MRILIRGGRVIDPASGAFACEKATQPASASSAISVSRSPASFTVSAPTG